MDVGSLRHLLAGPGMDTRQWHSYGLVKADTPGSRSVLFVDEQGNPRPYPVVLVTLQPSGIDIACRVKEHGGGGAGAGEWHPFVAGDEVWVEIPGGDERNGGVISGRFSQSRDAFPTMVAGNDPTLNNFSFKRLVEPYVLESGTSLLFRTTPTGAFISIGQTGSITAQSGDGHYLSISHDMISLQTQDLSCTVQIDPAAKTVFVEAGGTQLLIDSAGKSMLLTGGSLSLGTSGNPPQWHATSAEAVVNLLLALGKALTILGAVPLTGASLGAVLTSPAFATIVSSAAALPLDPVMQQAINTALLAGTLATPNVGVAGLIVG